MRKLFFCESDAENVKKLLLYDKAEWSWWEIDSFLGTTVRSEEKRCKCKCCSSPVSQSGVRSGERFGDKWWGRMFPLSVYSFAATWGLVMWETLPPSSICASTGVYWDDGACCPDLAAATRFWFQSATVASTPSTLTKPYKVLSRWLVLSEISSFLWCVSCFAVVLWLVVCWVSELTKRERTNPQKSGSFIAQEAKDLSPRVFPHRQLSQRRRYISHTHIFEYSSYPINLSGTNKRRNNRQSPQEKKYCIFEARTLALSSSHPDLLAVVIVTHLPFLNLFQRQHTESHGWIFLYSPLLFAASHSKYTENLPPTTTIRTNWIFLSS